MTAQPQTLPGPGGDLPTQWKKLPSGKWLIVNPNRCLICHRPRHPNTPHHDFIPDEATPNGAAHLHWPFPPKEQR